MKALKYIFISTTVITSAFLMSSCTNNSASSQEKTEIVELQPSNFKPIFTRDTVIKLNKIVSRQLEVIDEYDSMIKNLRQAVVTKRKNSNKEEDSFIYSQMNTLTDLNERSKINLADIREAEKVLIESKEHYNKTTFEGMKSFVKQVEKEISNEKISLEKLINHSMKIVNQ